MIKTQKQNLITLVAARCVVYLTLLPYRLRQKTDQSAKQGESGNKFAELPTCFFAVERQRRKVPHR